jgi:class 3 adenylate cyclase/tetratricopeptide (TPR) repeat protein
MTIRESQVERIQRALLETRNHKHVFSTQAYGQIVMALLNELRRARTVMVTAPTTTDEIRLVTVMFIDIINSTEMAQVVEASDWKTIIDEAHTRLSALIEQWDGQVGQYLGDGLLCFFGAARSRGDDALRAVSCGLAAQESLKAYAQEIRQKYPLDFAARIGMSTGRVVVGLIGGPAKQELLALGPATNLAARLQLLAGTGGIVVDAATHNRVRNHFTMQAQPPVKVKGFEFPIKYYNVLGRGGNILHELTATSVNDSPLVFHGRQPELEQLQQLQEDTFQAHRFQVVTLVGETGVGKSRLIQELLHRQSEGVMPLVMVARYEKRSVSYNILRDFLMHTCEITDETPVVVAQEQIMAYVTGVWATPEAANTAAILGYLGGFGFQEHPAVMALRQPGQEPSQVAGAAIARWLRALSDMGGILLIVDNLQWADLASIQLLEYLAQELATMPGILLAAARPAYRQQYPLYMHNVPYHTTLLLEQLAPETTAAIIKAALAPIDRVPDSLAQTIQERAAGNPLFIQEFLSMLFDNGVFYPHNNGTWRFNLVQYRTTEDTLPGGLIGVMQARLDDLPPDARQVLQLASVIGQTFWEGAVAVLTGTLPRTLLETLVARGIILRDEDSMFPGEQQYTFQHTLYHDVAYDSLPRARREMYHRQIARWFVPRVPERPDLYAILAQHFEDGGQHEAALATYLEAMQNRIERGLLTESLTLNEHGLSLARRVPRSVALPIVSRLWTLRGQALLALGRYAEASAASQSAVMLLREVPDEFLNPTRFQANYIAAQAHIHLGHYDEAYQSLLVAQDFLDEKNLTTQAQILHAFAMLRLYQGRLQECLEYQQSAAPIVDRLQDIRLRATSALLAGRVAMNLGDAGKALTYFDEALTLYSKQNDRHNAAILLGNIGYIYMLMLSYDRALLVLEDTLSYDVSIGGFDRILHATRGLVLVSMGRATEGMPLLWEATQRSNHTVYNDALIQLLLLRALILTSAYATAQENALAFVKQMRDRNPLLYGRGLLWLGLAQAGLKDAAATATLQEALYYEQQYGGRELWLCYEALAQVTPDNADRAQYLAETARVLRAFSDTLHPYPDLQHAFLNNSYVQSLLSAGVP